MKELIERFMQKKWAGWTVFLGTMVCVFALGLFAASIMERRSESYLATQLVTPIPEWEPRNEVWGENYPREFETYKDTLDTSFKSKHGGGAVRDYLEEDPNLVILWAGYAFSKDYKQARGHYHAIEDIKETLRTNSPQPATCWTCKSTDVPRLMKEMGVAEFYKKKWPELVKDVVNNIGCQDCHDPKTLNLRITRPELIEAMKRRGVDVTKSTHQQMRSLVCAQCHVEYYFKGEGKYLTFPWDKGFSADEMEAYYDDMEHVDWVHSISKTPMLKAQHPDYELYMTGTHAERGVSCADCHMPYKSEGGMKFTDHKIQSPLNNISNSCGVCHRWSEDEVRNKVYSMQDKIAELKMLAEAALVKAHIEAGKAIDAGATENEMKPIQELIRHAQWRWDWVAAANGLSFHSSLEGARVLGTSIQKAEEARRLISKALVKHGVTEEITLPDISTKEKAQKYIGIDMVDEKAQKEKFLRNE